jgi:hypothetical protein
MPPTETEVADEGMVCAMGDMGRARMMICDVVGDETGTSVVYQRSAAINRIWRLSRVRT